MPHPTHYSLLFSAAVVCITVTRMSDYNTVIIASFQDNAGKPIPECQTILNFTAARDDGSYTAPSSYLVTDTYNGLYVAASHGSWYIWTRVLLIFVLYLSWIIHLCVVLHLHVAVCVKFLNNFIESLDENTKSTPAKIEDAFRKFCKATKGDNNRFVSFVLFYCTFTLVWWSVFLDNLVSRYQNVKPFWILLQQETMEAAVVPTWTL